MLMMFQMLYYKKPYLRKLKTTIREIRGNLLLLEDNIFFPGAGGQASDKGSLDGIEVKEALLIDSEVWLKVDHHQLRKGTIVELKIDWDHRYKLMKAHTAEHLLLRAITQLAGNSVELYKIEIKKDSAKVVIRGQLTWSILKRAMDRVNEWIWEGRAVTDRLMETSMAKGFHDIRARWERIHNSQVRVVFIEGVDAAACKGLHVHNTREIRMFHVKGFHRERLEGLPCTVVEFLVDLDAIREMQTRSFLIGDLQQLFPTTPLKNLVNTVTNILVENRGNVKTIKTILTHLMDPDNMVILPDETRILRITFQNSIPKVVMKTCNKLVELYQKVVICLFGYDYEKAQLQVYFTRSKAVKVSLGGLISVLKASTTWKGSGNDKVISGKIFSAEVSDIDRIWNQILSFIHSTLVG